MAGSNNFLQWNPTQANQENDASYLSDAQRTGGAPNGTSFPSQTGNKLFYQVSTFVAAFAQMMATKGFNMLDTNISTLAATLAAILTTADINFSPSIVTVPFSATPAFNLTSANPLHPVFEITLTGNVTSSSFTGVPAPGSLITFHVLQDGTGGRTFVPPAAAPMATIDGTPNQVNSQTFHVLADNSLVPAGPMTLKI